MIKTINLDNAVQLQEQLSPVTCKHCGADIYWSCDAGNWYHRATKYLRCVKGSMNTPKAAPSTNIKYMWHG